MNDMFREYSTWRTKLEQIEGKMRGDVEFWKQAAEKAHRDNERDQRETAKAKELPKYPHYACPLYREASRAGTLTTTGHSTNFIMDMKLPIKANDTQKHWIKCGAALLLELSF